MKALVIGASGLVGGALVRALERSGIETVGTCHTHRSPEMFPLEVADGEAVRSCLERIKPDVVFLTVNVAGGVDFCETHPNEARTLNITGTHHVVSAAIGCGAKVVYYSTDYIFDGKSGPYSEENIPSPLSIYGQTKLEAERIVQKNLTTSLILRTTAVFGWDRASQNFAMQVWRRLQAGQSMRVAKDQWCNPTLVDYLAEVSVRLVQLGAHGTFNVVGKDRLPRSELAKSLARTMALDPELILPVSTPELGPRAPRPLEGGLKTKKLEETFGTVPHDLGESLKRFRRQWRADTHITHVPGAVSTEAERLKQEILQKVRQYYRLVHQPKPFVPFKSRVQYSGRVFGEEEMVNLTDSALDFWLTLGVYGDLFEQKMKLFFGSKDFVLVNSGSTANLTVVMALCSRQLERPLKAGDEVITPAVTFPTTLTPLVHSGLIPVFVDCNVGTYNISPSLIEGAISDKTRAIFVPHTLGNPCDMDILCDIVRRHNLYLIEDTCDALGSTFRGKLVGTFGDLATLSFFPAHHITMGEGGGVIVNNARLARIVRSVRDWGRDCWCAPGESNTCGKRFGWQLGDLPRGYDHKYIFSNLGYNFKPTDLQASIGVAQAERIPDFVEKRHRNFRQFYKALEPYQSYLILPTLDPRSDPSWFGFPITVTNGLSRAKLVQWLENANIETRQIFGGNILKQPGYQGISARIHGTLEQSDRIMRDSFFIGVYPGLTDDMLQHVIQTFSGFFKTEFQTARSSLSLRE
ncbi:MAG: lipopolysaccharide biosynthesis protein RfbH [Candidatus Omnitrophica bacterium]|nr:lipopolysaccharide biosynthesis protein RfbH [Candidatus Omnitrophota bacterium]